MKVVLFGATGTIGQRILKEALSRGHEVTAVVREISRLNEEHERLQVVTGDLLDPGSVAEAVKGHEAVITAYGPKFGAEGELLEATRSLIEGMRRAEVSRLLIVGGAGSLEVSPGVYLMDTPEFPEEVRPLAMAHADAYELYRESELEWTYVSPASTIEPGPRYGNFRIGTDKLITDETGASKITAEDYAAALIDELEDPYFTRACFTVAY